MLFLRERSGVFTRRGRQQDVGEARRMWVRTEPDSSSGSAQLGCTHRTLIRGSHSLGILLCDGTAASPCSSLRTLGRSPKSGHMVSRTTAAATPRQYVLDQPPRSRELSRELEPTSAVVGRDVVSLSGPAPTCEWPPRAGVPSRVLHISLPSDRLRWSRSRLQQVLRAAGQT